MPTESPALVPITDASRASPGKKRRILAPSHDLLLNSSEGTSSLPIESGHLYIEDAEQAICLVLDARRRSLSSPRHSFSNTEFGQNTLVPEQRFGYAREGLERPSETGLGP